MPSFTFLNVSVIYLSKKLLFTILNTPLENKCNGLTFYCTHWNDYSGQCFKEIPSGFSFILFFPIVIIDSIIIRRLMLSVIWCENSGRIAHSRDKWQTDSKRAITWRETEWILYMSKRPRERERERVVSSPGERHRSGSGTGTSSDYLHCGEQCPIAPLLTLLRSGLII